MSREQEHLIRLQQKRKADLLTSSDWQPLCLASEGRHELIELFGGDPVNWEDIEAYQKVEVSFAISEYEKFLMNFPKIFPSLEELLKRLQVGAKSEPLHISNCKGGHNFDQSSDIPYICRGIVEKKPIPNSPTIIISNFEDWSDQSLKLNDLPPVIANIADTKLSITAEAQGRILWVSQKLTIPHTSIPKGINVVTRIRANDDAHQNVDLHYQLNALQLMRNPPTIPPSSLSNQ